MNKINSLILMAIWLFGLSSLSAQNVLSFDQVRSLINDNNYDLQLARQNIASAEVLTSKYNKGYMPTLGLNAGVNYGLNSQKSVFNFNFPDLLIRNNPNYSATLGAQSSYLIYDGGQRDLRFDQNKANLELAGLQVENLGQLLEFNASQIYYNIVQAMFSENVLKETLDISRQRYKRVKTYYEYGSRNRVDVLNAEVDISRDSLNLISLDTDIQNLKWQLNQITLQEDVGYEVDTSLMLNYRLATIEELEASMINSNAELMALKKNTDLVQYDLAIANKLNGPTINANGAYNINYQKNSSKGQLDYNRTNGLNLGLAANWNILDGGQRKVQEQLAEIGRDNASLEFKTKENELRIRLQRLWNTYQNNLLNLDFERKNIKTNKVNFQLVRELYQNGQQSSVEFRQAQLNLMNAQLQYYQAKISAKLNELEIDYLLSK